MSKTAQQEVEASDSSDLDLDEKQKAKLERKYAKIEKRAMERAMTQVQKTSQNYRK